MKVRHSTMIFGDKEPQIFAYLKHQRIITIGRKFSDFILDTPENV